MLKKSIAVALAVVVLLQAGDADARGGLPGLFDRIKGQRQAKQASAQDGARVLSALLAGKGVIFFPTSGSKQVWADDLGDGSFEIGGFDGATPELSSVGAYAFMVLEPGTYYLQSDGPQNFHKTQHVGFRPVAGKPAAGLGQTLLVNTQFAEPYTASEWRDEVGHTEQVVVGQQCTWTDNNGNCQAMGPITQPQYIVDHPAGNYPVTKYQDADGVSLWSWFDENQSPARVTVGAGEVVVTDEIFFELGKSVSYDGNQCAKNADGAWQCATSAYEFGRDAGDGLRWVTGNLRKAGWPEQKLALIKYRPMEIRATLDHKASERYLYYRNP